MNALEPSGFLVFDPPSTLIGTVFVHVGSSYSALLGIEITCAYRNGPLLNPKLFVVTTTRLAVNPMLG